MIVATSKRALNRWIGKLADARAIPVNVVDDREASRFIVPAIIDRDPVLVAVSTGGASPVLARRLRERLEAFIPSRLGSLASWLRELRAASRRRLRGTSERRRYFEAVVDGAAARRFIEGDRRGALRIARQLLSATFAAPRPAGSVTLVGAGPGDPELLTLKALRALQDADVVLHDRLVSDAVLDLARRDATLICVGKAAGGASTEQARIHELLIEHAQAGRRVVRLKGGDPFIFGRGGEELEALARAHIDFSVVPGITAAAGCAAYAGIPLTHREHAHSVSFVTGHADAQRQRAGLALARQTRRNRGVLHGPRALGSHRDQADRARRGRHASGRDHCAGHDRGPAGRCGDPGQHSRRRIARQPRVAGAAGRGRCGGSALHSRLVQYQRAPTSLLQSYGT